MFSGMNITDPADQTVLVPGQTYWFTFYTPTWLSPDNGLIIAVLNNSGLGGMATFSAAGASYLNNYITFSMTPLSVAEGTTVEGWVLSLTSAFQSQPLWSQVLSLSNISDAQFVSVSDSPPSSSITSSIEQAATDVGNVFGAGLGGGVSSFLQQTWPYFLGGGLLLIILLKKK